MWIWPIGKQRSKNREESLSTDFPDWWIVKGTGTTRNLFLPMRSSVRPDKYNYDFISGPMDQGEATIQADVLNAKTEKAMDRLRAQIHRHPKQGE